MNNITQIQDLFPGIRTVYIYKVSDVVSMGDEVAGTVQGIVASNYYKFEFEQNSSQHEAQIQNKKNIVNINNLELFLPGNDLANILLLQQLDGQQVILRFIDNEGNYYILGSIDNPLTITDDYSTGEKPSDSSGRKIKIAGNALQSIFLFEDVEPVYTGNTYFVTTNASVTVYLKGSAGANVTFINESNETFVVELLGNTTEVSVIVTGPGQLTIIEGAEFIYSFRTVGSLSGDAGITEFENISNMSILNTFKTPYCSALVSLDFSSNDSIYSIQL